MRCLLQICCPSSLLFSHRQWSKELRMATQTLGLGSSPRLQTGKSGLQACPLKHAARPASHVQQLLDLLATYLVRAALPEQDLDLGDVNEWDPLVQLGLGHMQLYSYGTAYLPDYMRVLRLLSTLLPALLMVPETCSLPSISYSWPPCLPAVVRRHRAPSTALPAWPPAARHGWSSVWQLL